MSSRKLVKFFEVGDIVKYTKYPKRHTHYYDYGLVISVVPVKHKPDIIHFITHEGKFELPCDDPGLIRLKSVAHDK